MRPLLPPAAPRPGAPARHGRLLAVGAAVSFGYGLAGCVRARTPPAAEPVAQVQFSDQTSAAGIKWRHVNGMAGRFYYPELVGGGGGFVDVDGDGWQDLVLVNSGAITPSGSTAGRHGLYLNNGDGTYRDATAGSGLEGPRYGMGVAAGDYDGDGRVDLYVTGLHDSRLFRNVGGGRFVDATTAPVRNQDHWATSASWADVDGDGRLDLFVGNYVQWQPEDDDVPCIQQGVRTHCGPKSYREDYCTLLMNRGGGRFEDVTRKIGLHRVPAKALGVNACDFNSDGHTDFMVTCDQVPNLLFRNRGAGAFDEVALEYGVAMAEGGIARAGMGLASQEEAPGRWSFWIGNFTKEGTSYYRQTSGELFEDAAPATNLVPLTHKVLTFGVAAEDFDRDSRLDLALANGHVSLEAERTRDEPTLQEPLLFQRSARGPFVDVSATAGPVFQDRYMARGLAAGDYDNDGDPDLLMVENHGPAHLWRNDTAASGHWIGFECRRKDGDTASDAPGTRIELGSPKGRQVRWVRSDGSYLTCRDPRALFGLGPESRVDSMTVRWPDGRSDTFTGLSVDQYWRLEPGKPPTPVSKANVPR